MPRPITVVARIPRTLTPEERIRSAGSWPIHEHLSNEADLIAHRKWWGKRLPSNVVLSVVTIPEHLRGVFDALKALLGAAR